VYIMPLRMNCVQSARAVPERPLLQVRPVGSKWSISSASVSKAAHSALGGSLLI
jgi:hypothetical protein